MADIITLSEYESIDRPNLYYLVDKLIPKPGMILLLGEAGVGKSFLAIQIALAVAQGKPFFHGHTTPGRVMYFQFDMSELIVRERLRALKKAGVDVNGPVFTLHPATAPKGINIMEPLGYNIIKDAINKSNPDLIIFDVLREMHNADEDSSSAMKPVGDTMSDLCKDRSVIIMHHPKKTALGMDPKVVDASRGSSYLAGKVDAVWMLHDGYFYIGKSRFSPGGRYRARQNSAGLFEFD